MAWKSPAGQKKPGPAPKNGDSNNSFPGLKPAGKDTGASGQKTKYEELQENEVMVLEAIVSSSTPFFPSLFLQPWGTLFFLSPFFSLHSHFILTSYSLSGIAGIAG